MDCSFYKARANELQRESADSTELYYKSSRDFPGGAVVKNPPAIAGDMGLIPGLGRSHMPWSS